LTEADEVGDAAAYAHLPSGKRLYGLLLSMTEEQVVNSWHEGGSWSSNAHYPILAELWNDIDEIASAMLDEDPHDPVASDYRTKWAELDRLMGSSAGARSWQMKPDEARERSRLIKRFMLRAGPLSLRRRQGDSSKDYWAKEALEFQ